MSDEIPDPVPVGPPIEGGYVPPSMYVRGDPKCDGTKERYVNSDTPEKFGYVPPKQPVASTKNTKKK